MRFSVKPGPLSAPFARRYGVSSRTADATAGRRPSPPRRSRSSLYARAHLSSAGPGHPALAVAGRARPMPATAGSRRQRPLARLGATDAALRAVQDELSATLYVELVVDVV